MICGAISGAAEDNRNSVMVSIDTGFLKYILLKTATGTSFENDPHGTKDTSATRVATAFILARQRVSVGVVGYPHSGAANGAD